MVVPKIIIPSRVAVVTARAPWVDSIRYSAAEVLSMSGDVVDANHFFHTVPDTATSLAYPDGVAIVTTVSDDRAVI